MPHVHAHRALLLLALLAPAGCASAAPAAAPALHTMQADLDQEPIVALPPTCQVTATEPAGCIPAGTDAEAPPAVARRALEGCRASGDVVIRVHRMAGQPSFAIVPGPSLDPRERQCVIDALTAVYSADNETLWSGGAGVPPTGFASALTIRW